MFRTTPAWDERQFPSLQATDLAENGILYDSLLRPVSGEPEGMDLLDWVNSHRLLLHQELAETTPLLEERLASRGVQLASIAECVAEITNAVPYPLNRVQLNNHMRSSRIHQKAVKAVTPGLAFTPDEPISGQYNPMLGIILLNDQYIRPASSANIAHVVAENLGQAATGSIVNARVQFEPEPAYRYWYGYQWWWRDERYGGAIQKAATEKIAALARQELNLIADGDTEDNPIIEPYRRDEGYYYESGMAMTLDVINARLGFGPTDPGIYQLIWHFGQEGGDDSARQGLDEMVKMATHNTVSIEDLEMVPVRQQGMPLGILQRIEEASGIDVSMRPSRIFVERGVERTD